MSVAREAGDCTKAAARTIQTRDAGRDTVDRWCEHQENHQQIPPRSLRLRVIVWFLSKKMTLSSGVADPAEFYLQCHLHLEVGLKHFDETSSKQSLVVKNDK